MDYDTLSVTYTFAIDLNSPNGTLYGMSRVAGDQETYYTVPVAYMERTPDDGWIQLPSTFYVIVSESGWITVSATSPYPKHTYLSAWANIDSDCDAGFQRVSSVFTVEFHAVYNEDLVVGPRSLRDIHMKPDDYPADTPFTCFGDNITDVLYEGCNDNICTWRLSFLSRCIEVHSSGDSFMNCLRVSDADRIADFGGIDLPYPLALNQRHDFFINV